VQFVDVFGDQQDKKNSLINSSEAAAVVSAYEKESKKGRTVILSPFRTQMHEVKPLCPEGECYSLDEFTSQTADTVLVSLV